jgi:preprotein translocase, YajC subunit
MNILAAAEAGGGINMMFIFVMYAVVIGGGYFLIVRPRKKEQRRMQGMMAELATGDTVLTTSGFYGVVIDVTEEDVVVEFGSNKNCRIPMRKEAIAQVEKPE